jgi:hypothetical protein
MPEMGRAMRLYRWMPAAILGLFAIYAVAAPSVHDKEDKWYFVLIFSTALLLPPVLYLLTLPRYLRRESPERDSPISGEARPGAFPLVLSVALYLPCMILMASSQQDEVSLLPRQITRTLVGSIPLFLILWIFCACASQWLRGERSVVPAENDRSPGGLHRCLKMTGRFLPPPVLLLLGAVLLTCTLWTDNSAFRLLKGQETWITAEYGLGEHIRAASVVLDFLGRFVYGASLLLAVFTVLLLAVCRFSSARLRASRAAAVLGLAAGFLAICSITDYYFSWQGFLLGNPLLAARFLFLLLFLHWLVPASVAVSFLKAGGEGKYPPRLALRTVVLFYMPLLLFDFAMTPFFVEDLWFSFLLVAFLGLQFLAWGYLQLATLPQELKH